MAVSVTEFEGLDPAHASVDSVADRAGTSPGESGLTILFPHLVQRLESRYGNPRLELSDAWNYERRRTQTVIVTLLVGVVIRIYS